MIKYYVGVDIYGGRTINETFHRMLKDSIDDCPVRYGFDTLDEAIEERQTLLQEGYTIVKIYKVEEL